MPIEVFAIARHGWVDSSKVFRVMIVDILWTDFK